MGDRRTAWPETRRAEISGIDLPHLDTDQGAAVVDWRKAAVQRVLSSSSFAKANRLSTFLEFVCRLTLDGCEHEINELNIGVCVFQRRENYNTSDDTIVRTTARGLRQRLQAHYETEGYGDCVRIDIPKGTYVPTLVQVAPEALDSALDQVAVATEEIVSTQAGAVSPETHRPKALSLAHVSHIALMCLAIGIGAATALIWVAPKHYLPWTRTPSDKLWAQVFPSDRTTYIVPADTVLLMYEISAHRIVPLDEYLGGNFFRPTDAGIPGLDLWMSDYRTKRYTAVTSVQMAEDFGQIPKAKPDRTQVRFARDLQTGDLSQSNAILIGAAQNNPWVQLFQKELNFHLDWVPSENSWRIRNDHPQSNEPLEWQWAKDNPNHVSFSHIALLHNLGGNGSVLILSGTNMFGSEAGSHFVFDPQKMNPLLKRALRSDGSIRTFEILLESNFVGNGTINTRIAATRFYP